MLVSLSIRNFVLIEDAVLEFDRGLTVLTGETGAGKTLLTKALGLLMGERAEDGLVGTAGDEAILEAMFAPDPEALVGLSDQINDLLSDAQEELIVTRRLSREGRNRCYVNGATVTLNTMGELLSRLLSFAGQHEYRRLLDPGYQLDMLDAWAGQDVLALSREYRRAFLEAQETARALEDARQSQEGRLRELRLLRYEVDELTTAGLSRAEEQALTTEQRLLAGAEDLLQAVGLAAGLLSAETDDPDATGLVAQASAHLVHVADIDEHLDDLARSLQELQYGLSELARELHAHVGTITVDPERLQTVDDRLRLYSDLARKYGGSTDAALRHLELSQERLALLERTEEDLFGLEEARAARCALALDLAAQLSRRRGEALPSLENTVRRELQDLGMPQATFAVILREREGWEGLRQSGAESAEFLLSANPGQPARSLASTASGGELSRVLLALKCALAEAGGDETLVFDEIDAGIGGRTAVAVAAKLRELSSRSQSIVVTHLPTVAAGATRHYLIDKVVQGESGRPGVHMTGPLTTTRLALLDDEAAVEELCRMMGGRPEDREAMAHARELRDRAQTS